jgi:hypothetical protein
VPASIARVLSKTPRQAWGSFAVVVDDELGTVELRSRGELASWLRANDLPDLADEALARRVGDGGILLLTIGRDETRFRVLGGRVRAPGVPRGRTSP